MNKKKWQKKIQDSMKNQSVNPKNLKNTSRINIKITIIRHIAIKLLKTNDKFTLKLSEIRDITHASNIK